MTKAILILLFFCSFFSSQEKKWLEIFKEISTQQEKLVPFIQLCSGKKNNVSFYENLQLKFFELSWKEKKSSSQYLFLNTLETITPEQAQVFGRWELLRLNLKKEYIESLKNKSDPILNIYNFPKFTEEDLILFEKKVGKLPENYFHTSRIIPFGKEENLLEWKFFLNDTEFLIKQEETTLTIFEKSPVKYLFLNGLSSLSIEIAQELSEFSGASLFLNGLNELSPEVAKKIAQFRVYRIFLNNLEILTEDTALELSKFKGDLSLNGLKKITPEALSYFESFEGMLFLNSITSITFEEAKILNQFKTTAISLDGLTEIEPKVAMMLATSKIKELSLNGLKKLTPELAKNFSQFKENLVFAGIEECSLEIVQCFSSFEGVLFFSLTNLKNPSSLKILVNKQKVYFLDFQFTKKITKEQAEIIIEIEKSSKTTLELDQLEEVTPEIAQVLIQFNEIRNVFREDWMVDSSISLNGLKELTPETAKILAQAQVDKLFLEGLENLSPEILISLMTFQGNVYLSGLNQISSEMLSVLVNFKRDLFFNTIENITPEMAYQLAQIKEGLHLNGIKEISPEVAHQLAQFQGTILSLDGIESLSEDSARAFTALRTFRFSLNGLKSLNLECAKYFAQFQAQKLELEKLENLSLEVANYLIQFHGNSLTLNVEHITPELAKIFIQFKGQMLNLCHSFGSEIDIEVKAILNQFKGVLSFYQYLENR